MMPDYKRTRTPHWLIVPVIILLGLLFYKLTEENSGFFIQIKEYYTGSVRVSDLHKGAWTSVCAMDAGSTGKMNVRDNIAKIYHINAEDVLIKNRARPDFPQNRTWAIVFYYPDHSIEIFEDMDDHFYYGVTTQARTICVDHARAFFEFARERVGDKRPGIELVSQE